MRRYHPKGGKSFLSGTVLSRLQSRWTRDGERAWQALRNAPSPKVVVRHADLPQETGRDGGTVPEDWMRVIQHLELRWNEGALPPDHLGAACDLLVCAIAREGSVLIRELRKRYLEPWCAVARERLTGKNAAIARLPEAFAVNLRAIELDAFV